MAFRFAPKCSSRNALIICCCVTNHPKRRRIKQPFDCVHRFSGSGIWMGHRRDELCLFHDVWGLSWKTPCGARTGCRLLRSVSCASPETTQRPASMGLSTGAHLCVLSLCCRSQSVALALRESPSGGRSTEQMAGAWPSQPQLRRPPASPPRYVTCCK